jgi:hypothetical protein
VAVRGAAGRSRAGRICGFGEASEPSACPRSLSINGVFLGDPAVLFSFSSSYFRFPNSSDRGLLLAFERDAENFERECGVVASELCLADRHLLPEVRVADGAYEFITERRVDSMVILSVRMSVSVLRVFGFRDLSKHRQKRNKRMTGVDEDFLGVSC